MPWIIKNRKIKRLHYWIIASLLASAALFGWLRFQQALRYWYYFVDLALHPRPLYFAISGGLVGIFFSIALLLHFIRSHLIRKFTLVISAAMLAWIYVDRIWIIEPQARAALLPVTVLITLATIMLNLLTIYLP